MKFLNHLVGLLLIISFKTSYSQIKANFGIGYNVGNHINVNGLDFVIKRYNETRSYLTTTMKSPVFFRGINMAADFYYPKCLVDFEWVVRKSDVKAETNTNQTRDLRFKENTFNMGLGWKAKSRKSGVTGSYAGIDFSTISVKNYTRTHETNGVKPDYQKINWDISVGFSPFLQLVGKRLTAKFYYQFMITDVNYWDVNRAINPNTWSGDDYDSNKGKASSIGFSLRYNLVKNH